VNEQLVKASAFLDLVSNYPVNKLGRTKWLNKSYPDQSGSI